jgi:3-hydroxybutyrate dehydrogenase
MSTSLQGKTALVTGSTSGIGLGIAIELAKQGANIVLNGFGDAASIEAARAQVAAVSVEQGAQVAAVSVEQGAKVAYHGADMSKPAEIEQMIAFAVKEFGMVDILVNNAGIQHVSPVENFPAEKWDAIIAINLSSAFHTTRLAIPGMRAKNWGRIINIASAHGLVASKDKSAYVAAKHGLVGFTKSIALETATTGITVNAICPGWVLTPLVQKQIDDRAAREGISIEQASKDLLSEKQPSLQFTTPKQLGELAVFLCQDAAANVRGQAWAVDGGWTAQ